MKAKDVKTYEEIIEYINNIGEDEFKESVEGIHSYYKYASYKQKEIIEKWVKEDWERVVDEFIEDESYYYKTFEEIDLGEKFEVKKESENTFTITRYVKISETEAVHNKKIQKFDKNLEVVKVY